ncbi:hypothetical protein PoB_002776500 [Plakobranchus ocellatus]|uniref:Uncharacterized protein n=1 Tax=Plakobranchus ocellatus TaxID=259542 RepID=A0AAV4A2Z0_9GAST|nr:hypothetical protein PoB_002776500 [Plakobranchus ocellatus]
MEKMQVMVISLVGGVQSKDHGGDASNDDHECEVLGLSSEASAVESASAWRECKKKPGHNSFIAASEFCVSDLPEQCRYPAVFKYVKCISDRTLRLRVGYTSTERPKGYSFHKDRGTDVLHTGSGLFCDVKYCESFCPCSECTKSKSPHQKWYLVIVKTACHTVYNSEEAKATKFDFFYDDLSCITDGRMKTLVGNRVVKRDIAADVCIIHCATHDSMLAKRLEYLQRETLERVASLMITKPLAKPNEVCIVMSHPHGQSKYLAVGRTMKCRKTRKGPKVKIPYTMTNCPGSSGGPIIMLNSKTCDKALLCNHEFEDLRRTPEAVEKDCFWNECTKNAQHDNFISAHEFCLNDLPEYCRYPEMLQYVQNISSRTIRLRVGCTSSERPKNNNFYNCRGTDVLRLGSGWIHDLKSFEGPCQCSECFDSNSPHHKWHLVVVKTACQMVYNLEEAKATKVDLFYDEESCRIDGRMKTLTGNGVVKRDVAADVFVFNCITHDDSLAKDLRNLLLATVGIDSTSITKQQAKLADICITVSHPHGQSKQIKVGESLKWMKTKRRCKIQVAYTAATCPGSSGGPVVMLDPRSTYMTSWSAVHSSGDSKKGLNKSSSAKPIRKVLRI